MWHILAISLYFSIYPSLVKTAWVEIPQVPTRKPTDTIQVQQKPAQFVLGAPKISFVDQRITTPPNFRVSTTPKTPSTSLQNYKDVMTTTIQPLTVRPQKNRKKLHAQARITPVKPKMEKNSNNTKTKPKNEETYSGFLPLLNSIQETLTSNAKKSLKSKISLLTNLKDNLLTNIDERMSSLWAKSDNKMEARGHDDHDMDFPSNEGALMTIGFLTFAVFLIKLVLKLINALKYKQANSVVVSTVAPAATFIGRKKRDIEDQSLKILQFIDEYKFT